MCKRQIMTGVLNPSKLIGLIPMPDAPSRSLSNMERGKAGRWCLVVHPQLHLPNPRTNIKVLQSTHLELGSRSPRDLFDVFPGGIQSLRGQRRVSVSKYQKRDHHNNDYSLQGRMLPALGSRLPLDANLKKSQSSQNGHGPIMVFFCVPSGGIIFQ